MAAYTHVFPVLAAAAVVLSKMTRRKQANRIALHGFARIKCLFFTHRILYTYYDYPINARLHTSRRHSGRRPVANREGPTRAHCVSSDVPRYFEYIARAVGAIGVFVLHPEL
jgi:hypothetical protein